MIASMHFAYKMVGPNVLIDIQFDYKMVGIGSKGLKNMHFAYKMADRWLRGGANKQAI